MSECESTQQRRVLEVSVHCPAAAVKPDGAVARSEGCYRQHGLRDEIIGVHVLVHYGEHEEGELGHRHLECQGGCYGLRGTRLGQHRRQTEVGIVDGN